MEIRLESHLEFCSEILSKTVCKSNQKYVRAVVYLCMCTHAIERALSMHRASGSTLRIFCGRILLVDSLFLWVTWSNRKISSQKIPDPILIGQLFLREHFCIEDIITKLKKTSKRLPIWLIFTSISDELPALRKHGVCAERARSLHGACTERAHVHVLAHLHCTGFLQLIVGMGWG